MSVRVLEGVTWKWQRTQASEEEVMQRVASIVAGVRGAGEAALREYTVKFDRVSQAADPAFGWRVPAQVLEDAWNEQPGGLREALQAAADRIRRFHALQKRGDTEMTGPDGETLGLTWRALRRVGLYIPGGRAAYPSTVLMNVIPAQVAGVSEIALVSPPQAETGWPHPLVLAAAHLLGVTEVYRVGGAQAIAALAYGVESIPRVDKIAGPGNLYVALAKRMVMGDVGIDSIAGPSEVFIVADDSANPAFVAADMLAQAEHDPEAGAVCVTTHPPLAEAVQQELERQLAVLPRREIAAASLERWGAIVTVGTLAEAIRLVNESAPEHVELLLRNPGDWLPKVRTAGALFLGAFTPEPVGDYYAGTNHTLPTFGSARFASGLGVDDFLRRMTYVQYREETLQKHADHIVTLAEAEGLHAHARSVRIRTEGRDEQ